MWGVSILHTKKLRYWVLNNLPMVYQLIINWVRILIQLCLTPKSIVLTVVLPFFYIKQNSWRNSNFVTRISCLLVRREEAVLWYQTNHTISDLTQARKSNERWVIFLDLYIPYFCVCILSMYSVRLPCGSTI